MEETCCKEEGEPVGSYPEGSRALGEGLGVEVDSKAVIEDCGWKTLLDEVVGACTHGGWGNYVGPIDCRGLGASFLTPGLCFYKSGIFLAPGYENTPA